MKKIYYLLACALGLINFSCSSDNDDAGGTGTDDKNGVEVSIQTSILTRAQVTTDFKQGDVMNLYAKTYGRLDADDLEKNIRATYDGSSWEINPSVYLQKDEKAFIYAVYPFVDGLSDLSQVPVDITSQVDVLYSGSFVPVTFTTHTAKLTMKHALALASFNISNQGYSGQGEVQQMILDGDVIYSSGAMNVQTGKVVGKEKNSIEVQVKKTIVAQGWKEDLPRIWTIPFTTKTSVAMLKVKIDGKQYETKMPEVEMRGGYQYIFRLVLTDHGLEFIPDQTETISLNQDTDAMRPLEGYGVLRISHKTLEFTIPTLSGDQVFGNIVWGDGNSESYAFGASHNFGSEILRETMIESWNSEGFQLQNLKGVEVIDISEY